MTVETHRLALVAADAVRAPANALFRAVAAGGAWTANPLLVPLSATAAGPATAWGLDTRCSPEFAALLDLAADPLTPDATVQAVLDARGVVGVTPAEVRSLLALMTWAASPAAAPEAPGLFAALLADLGLTVVEAAQ